MRTKEPPRLLLMTGDGAFRTRLTRAVARLYSIHSVATWEELRDAIIDSPPNTIVVVDSAAGRPSGPRPARPFTALLEAFPSASFFAVVQRTGNLLKTVPALATYGLADVIVIGHDDTATALRERFRRGHGRPLMRMLDSTLPATLDPHARAIVAAAGEVVNTAGLSADLAAKLRTSRRTLLRACRRAQLPPPRRLLAWIRVLQAASLLDEHGRTVADVARACGYSSDAALRRITVNFVGCSPSVMRRRGAAEAARRAFIAELEALARSSTARDG